jgi:hypothetical protein
MVKKDFSVLSPEYSLQGFDVLTFLLTKDKEAVAIVSFLLALIISDSGVVSTVSSALVAMTYSLVKFYVKERKKE